MNWRIHTEEYKNPANRGSLDGYDDLDVDADGKYAPLDLGPYYRRMDEDNFVASRAKYWELKAEEQAKYERTSPTVVRPLTMHYLPYNWEWFEWRIEDD